MRVTWNACGATTAGRTGPGRSEPSRAAGHRHVAPPHLPDHEGQGHGKLVFEGPVPAAFGKTERRPGAQPVGARVRRVQAAHPPGLRPGLCDGRQFVGVRLPARRPRQPRDRRAFGRRQTRPRTCAGRIRHAALPVGRHRGAPHRPGRRVHRRTHRTNARRVRHHAFAFQAGHALRQRGGRIHRPADQEGAHIRQHVHERGTTALGRQPVRVVVQPPAAPLDPRIHESHGVHQTRENPPGTVQHAVANPRYLFGKGRRKTHRPASRVRGRRHVSLV